MFRKPAAHVWNKERVTWDSKFLMGESAKKKSEKSFRITQTSIKTLLFKMMVYGPIASV